MRRSTLCCVGCSSLTLMRGCGDNPNRSGGLRPSEASELPSDGCVHSLLFAGLPNLARERRGKGQMLSAFPLSRPAVALALEHSSEAHVRRQRVSSDRVSAAQTISQRVCSVLDDPQDPSLIPDSILGFRLVSTVVPRAAALLSQHAHHPRRHQVRSERGAQRPFAPALPDDSILQPIPSGEFQRPGFEGPRGSQGARNLTADTRTRRPGVAHSSRRSRDSLRLYRNRGLLKSCGSSA